jgi:phosphomannomutase
MARERGCLVSQLTQCLPARFTASDRIQSFPTETSQKILSNLAQSTASIDKLLAGLCGSAIALDLTDGLRIHLENNEIVHFRPSGNAPELRCYAESDSKERADQLVRECLLRMQAGL